MILNAHSLKLTLLTEMRWWSIHSAAWVECPGRGGGSKRQASTQVPSFGMEGKQASLWGAALAVQGWNQPEYTCNKNITHSKGEHLQFPRAHSLTLTEVMEITPVQPVGATAGDSSSADEEITVRGPQSCSCNGATGDCS